MNSAERHDLHRKLLVELAEDDKSFNTDEQQAIMAAVTALDALRYVFGQMDMIEWRAIVDRELTPPWPLEIHAKNMGIIK